jgi:hypothetical protein
MATLQIENLPDELYNQLQSLAIEKNFTLDETVIHLLMQAFQSGELKQVQLQQPRTTAEILEKIRSRPRVNPIDFGLPDSTILIQEDRNR